MALFVHKDRKTIMQVAWNESIDTENLRCGYEVV